MPGDLVIVQKLCVKGKHKLGDKWEHGPYTVSSVPNDDIPVYEACQDNSRAKKTRLLHRSLFLPLVGLPPLDEKNFEEDPESLVVAGGDQLYPKVHTNSEDSLLSENDDSSDNEAPLELDHQDNTLGKYDGTDKRYVITMPRGPDHPGVYPRNTALPLTRAQEFCESSGSSSQSSSDDEDRPQRSQRSQKKPIWMRSDDWALSQNFVQFNCGSAEVTLTCKYVLFQSDLYHMLFVITCTSGCFWLYLLISIGFLMISGTAFYLSKLTRISQY